MLPLDEKRKQHDRNGRHAVEGCWNIQTAKHSDCTAETRRRLRGTPGAPHASRNIGAKEKPIEGANAKRRAGHVGSTAAD
jgi:hypothetical protein